MREFLYEWLMAVSISMVVGGIAYSSWKEKSFIKGIIALLKDF